MTMRMHNVGRGAAALLVALSAFLSLGSQPADAGLFDWLSGRGQGRGDPDAAPSRGLFDRGGYEPDGTLNDQPRSRAFGGSHVPPEDPNPAVREWLTNPQAGLPTLSPSNIGATNAAIQRYQAIAAQGGWPMVPAYAMRPGSRGKEVEILKQRLAITGELSGRSVPREYDPTLTEAVRVFQRRHGLPPTGSIDRQTIDALNVPVQVRISQLQAGVRRLQAVTKSTGNRYVVVNVPAAQVEAVENGQVVSRHTAVVGKPARPTPEISSKIQEINFNPHWNVPKTIVYKDLVPKGREMAQKGQDMLAAYHMRAFDASGRPLDSHAINWNSDEVFNYTYRQMPWEENSLGFVKINFPNKDAVYLHDTPLKSVFGRKERFESSGCVRVHNIESLITWILRDSPGWSMDRVLYMKQTAEQANVRVPKPVPVFLTYISAWSTPDGVIHFRPDIYGHDGVAETASVTEY
jgi:murein L,D-transpeptidase YcbB/YkuD